LTSGEVGLDRPHVFVPAEQSVAGPSLLLLHGTGGNEYDLLPLRDRLSPGAAVLSVRGTVLENGMPRFFRRLQEGVFDEVDLRQRADDLGDFVATASAAYNIEERSLVAVGFSNGANIASALLLQRPGLVRATVLLSAMIPFADPPQSDLEGTLVIISNGARDPMIQAPMTAELVGQFRDRGAEVVVLPHAGGHHIDPVALTKITQLIARPERPYGSESSTRR
jgi:phospholipase/carboxylesterase